MLLILSQRRGFTKLGRGVEEVGVTGLAVNAFFDPAAPVWVAAGSDVPGLVTASDTVAALETRLVVFVPETAVINAAFVAKEQRAGPLSLALSRTTNAASPSPLWWSMVTRISSAA